MLSSEITPYEPLRVYGTGHVVNVSTLVGPNYQTQALARKMQRRGEIACTGGVKRLPHGIVLIEYVRLRPERDVRRALRLRAGALGVSGLMFLSAVATAAWQARYVLLSLAGAVLLLTSLRYLATRGRHRGACLGLHCPGCH